jgi:hypothetical protein
MAKRRMERTVETESPWDRLLAFDQQNGIERAAYQEACELDKVGKYAEADEVLRAAGVKAGVVADRRRHINWRLSQGKFAIGE